MAISTLLFLDPGTNSSITGAFFQYGILGIVALLLGYFAWSQYHRLLEKNDKLEQKVDKLQEDMMRILVEERDRMSELIKDNTIALQELQKTIVTYIVRSENRS
jgi:hypothetical protein